MHVLTESKPRGTTPLTVSLKAGEYRLRFMDHDGKYEETTRLFKVDKNTSDSMFVILNKWITVKVKSMEQPGLVFKTNVKISGHGLNFVKEVSSTKPLRIALPPDSYSFTFEDNEDFKPYIVKGVNIASQIDITGELEFASMPCKVIAKDEVSNSPVMEAYVWVENKLVGKTNIRGEWKMN